MSAIRTVAVIDVGKTNAKLVLIDRQTGVQLDARSRPNAVMPGPPYPHYDIDGLWEFFLQGLAALNREHGIDGISVTTHGATAALLADDALALPVLDYEHHGPDEAAADYERMRPGFGEALSPRLPVGLNLGAQLYWQQHAFPDAFATVTAIVMYPQFWAMKLTGVAASEATSLGCHTDLWQPGAGRFSSLVDKAGWTALFPPVRPAASVLGPVTADIAAATGLPPDTPVACGIHDSNASLLPYLKAYEPPFSVVSSGTWTIVMTVGGTTDKLDAGRDCLANVDASGQAVPTARFMGGRDYAILVGDATAKATPASALAVIDRQVFALPGFSPGVGPFPNSIGGWTGDEASLTPGERAAAASLYEVMMTMVCLDLAGAGNPVIVEGPLAGNAVYCRALAALTASDVIASADTTGTSAGAAMLFGGPRTADTAAAVKPLEAPGLADYAKRWRALAEES